MVDVLVIGGGPGGYAAAIRAAQLGARTTLVEAEHTGGTCVNHGCIPTKVWHRAAALMHDIRQAEDFGIAATLQGLNLQTLRERQEGVAQDIRMGMEALLANNGVTLLNGRARLHSPAEVEVAGRLHTAKSIILATGSTFHLPHLAGLEDAALTSRQALELTQLPKSLLVWGGGPIEVELAAFFRIFGVQVTLVENQRRILPREDGDVSQRVAQGLRELGVEILTRTHLEAVEKASNGFTAVVAGNTSRRIPVSRILLCARRPNTAGLNIAAVGIQLKDDGSIEINDHLQTSQPGIYAAGDCTGGWMLSHVATAMGVTAAENALGAGKTFPFRLISRAIWTIPEVGAVGLGEEAAEQEGYNVETGSFPYSINGLAMARNETAGEVKVVFEPRYGEILGVHITGSRATELIGEAVMAMQLEATVQELAAGFRAHPTFSESLVDAAREARNWALYLPRR